MSGVPDEVSQMRHQTGRGVENHVQSEHLTHRIKLDFVPLRHLTSGIMRHIFPTRRRMGSTL